MWQSLSGSFGERKSARAIIKHTSRGRRQRWVSPFCAPPPNGGAGGWGNTAEGRGARTVRHAPLREQLTATDRSAAQTAPEGRQPAPKRWLLPHKTAQKVSLFCVTLRAPFAQNRTKKGFCVTLGGLTAARSIRASARLGYLIYSTVFRQKQWKTGYSGSARGRFATGG